MKRYFTEEEIKKAKMDKSVRDEIRARIEEKLAIGTPRPVTIDGPDPEGAYKMGAYRMTRREANKDAIRQFCDAIDDQNPLYRSRDYAKNSIYGTLIAPPQFLSAIAPYSGIAKATESLDFYTARLDAGVSMEWFRIIYEGDRFTVTEYPIAVKDLTREKTALQFLVTGKRVYKNQRNEIVAVAEISGIAVVIGPPSPDKQIGKKITMARFSEEKVEEWYRLMVEEKMQGGRPRMWEDVSVGEQVWPTHHVFSMTEDIAFTAAKGKSYSWRQQMAARGENWKNAVDPVSGLPDFTNWHQTDAAAQRQGMPYANCLADQVRAWLGRMIEHWMGDGGILKKMSDQVRGTLYRESLALCKGEVVRKYVEGHKHLIDLSLTVEDHNGNMIIPNGAATIVLPARGQGW